MTPYGFLRAAAANTATVKTQTVGGKTYNVVSFIGQNKAMVNGYINDQNIVETRGDLDRQSDVRRHAVRVRLFATTRTSAA